MTRAGIVARSGDAVVDLPPLVEFGESVEALDHRRSPVATGRRPVRRRFLAPLSDAIPAAPPPFHEPSAAFGTRAQLLLPPAEPQPTPAGRPPRRAAIVEEPVRYAAKRRRWRRLAVAGGVAAALALAVGVEVGTRTDWFGRVRVEIARQLMRAPPLPAATEAPTDPARRFAYYSERVKAGDADAQLALAILYAKGDGVGQDYAAAARWFRAAAEKGVARAQYDFGVLCERGRGVPLDYAQAAAWYRKAAEQNHPLAQYNLAVAYTKGQGVRRDLLEAAGWYRRAAAQGVVAAMLNLAILYERGDGVAASTVDAYAWYRAAAQRGSEAAESRADALLRAFSPWDQTHAEAKTADVAAAIRDRVGERARLAANGAPPTDGAAPALKSGIAGEQEATPDADTRAERP